MLSVCVWSVDDQKYYGMGLGTSNTMECPSTIHTFIWSATHKEKNLFYVMYMY